MLDGDDNAAEHPVSSRSICTGCRRPCSVCICNALPTEPIALSGSVLVLQHPFEVKKRLGTVKLLQQCLAHCDVLVGRRFEEHLTPVLTAVLADAAASRYPLYVLFPQPDAVPLDQIELPVNAQPATPAAGSDRQPQAEPAYVLLVIDGTWQQGREIFNRLAPRLLPQGGPGVGVQLPQSPPSSCLIRKEPAEGCLTTMEAAARALGILERDASLVDTLLAPLVLATALQAKWSPTVRQRLPKAVEAGVAAGVDCDEEPP